jgi:glycosyltransferase involved in cell wall biosynthesis
MTVVVLVPAIHERRTGGNTYNRRVASHLESRAAVRTVPWRPQEGLPDLDDATGAAVMVDSLHLRRPDAVRALREAHPEAALVLLSHYLHCVDPSAQESDAAAGERAVLPLFDGAITPSRYVRQGLVDEGMPATHVVAAPPGLDDRFRTNPPPVTPTTRPRLLTVANPVPGKGLPILIDALARCRDRPWTATLVGDEALRPDYTRRVRARIREADLTDRIEQTGALPPEALRRRYDHADLFVLPSRFETCSMATREAMARGCAVVATDVGGLPENLGEAPAGVLVPPEAPAALTEALRPLLTDPDRRQRMARAAREHSRAFPAWTDTAQRIAALLTDLRR